MVYSFLLKLKKWISMISVEPVLLLYLLAFMITNIVEQAFFVDKACRVNHNFTDDVCSNLTSEANEEKNKEVQVTASEFHQWNDIAGHIVPIILAFFMGAWSDKRGRKIPLLMGLIGKCYYSTMIVVNAMQPTWPVEYIIYTATLPMAFTGADVAIFAAAFSYLSDITTPEHRTLRVTILEVVYLSAMPTGIALGSYLFHNQLQHSYAQMFIVNASLLFAAIVYGLIFLEWRTSERQRPLSEASNILTDFFDLNHFKSTIRTVTKWRPANRRVYLLIMIVSMGFYSFQRDERNMSFLYFQLVPKWSIAQISTFRSTQSGIQVVVLLTAVAFMSKILGWRDTVILMFGASAHCIARIFYATARTDWLYYLGGAVAAFGPIASPVIRSIASKLVPIKERGKAFALLSVTDNAIPLISGTVYNQVYKNTLYTHPEYIFYVTIMSQLIVLFGGLYINFRATEADLMHTDDDISIEDDEVQDVVDKY